MADITLVKISALPAAEQIGAEDLLPVVQEGATKAVAYGVIKDDIAEELAPDATLSEAGKAADAKAVGDALALKADKTELTAEVSRIDAALATKANANDVNAALATKANADDVTAALALKADTATVNTELEAKVDTDTVNAALALKADKTELTAGLATKQNVLTFDTEPTDGSTNPVTSGGVYSATADINGEINYLFEDGNNLLPIRDYTASYRGITLTVSNGVITIEGTATNTVRVKLSGDAYEMVGNAKEEWKLEELPQFEVGKTYSLHNIIVSGELPSADGVSLRGHDGASVVSATIPQETLSDTIAYAMLYIAANSTVDVSFIPAFIEGTVDEPAYVKKLNPAVYVEGATYSQNVIGREFIYNSTFESALKLPDTYEAAGEKTPLIVLAHGLSSGITANTWGSANMKALVGKFAESGYAVFDVNQVTSADWCNPALVKKYIRGLNNVIKNYNVTPVAIFGESMGSLIGLCLSTLISGIKVCAISGIRLDFEARYNQITDQTVKAIIDSNLGFTSGYDAVAVAGVDKTAIPAVDGSINAICNAQFPPTFFLYGTSDTTTKQESLAKIPIIKAGGTICKQAEYDGDHTAMCYLLADNSYDDVMEWFSEWV